MHHAVELPYGQRIHRVHAREQPAAGQHLALSTAYAPPSAQPRQHHRAEHGVAVLGALALLDAQRHALAVDVTDLEPAHLAGAQTGAVGYRQRGLVFDVAGGRQQRRCLLHAQHHRHGARQLHRLHAGHQLAAAQLDIEEELQPGQGRVERDGRGASVDQMQLEATQILDRGGVGRALEEDGQLADGADVGFLGSGFWVLGSSLRMRMTSSMRRRSGETAGVVVCMVAAPLMNEADCLARQLRRTHLFPLRNSLRRSVTARAV